MVGTSLRTLGVLGLLATALVAALGPVQLDRNVALHLVSTITWGGVLLTSVLVGVVWPRIDPLRAMASLLDLNGTRQIDVASGYRAAALALAVFALLTVVITPSPLVVLIFLVGYTSTQLVAASRYGTSWWQRGELLSVVSGVFAILAPVGRDPSGRPFLHDPRLATVALQRRLVDAGSRAAPALSWLLAVLTGIALADGLFATEAWSDVTVGSGDAGAAGLQLGAFTLGVLVAAALFVPVARRPAFVPALVPLAAAWTIPLYLGALAGDLPRILAAAGTDIAPDAPLVPAVGLIWVQYGMFVAGHALAIIKARALAVISYRPAAVRTAELPVRAAIVTSLLLGIAVRFAIS